MAISLNKPSDSNVRIEPDKINPTQAQPGLEAATTDRKPDDYEITKLEDYNPGTQAVINDKPGTNTPSADADTWQLNRQQGLAQGGKVKCTFARVWIPGANKVSPLFSIQKATISDYILEDCEVEELDQQATREVFGVVAPCAENDYFDLKKWHVGRLSDDIWKYIQKYKGGQPTTPYVLYDPRDWTWESAGAFKGAGLTSKAKRRKWLMWLLAGASFLFN